MFKELRIRDRNGRERALGKVCCGGDVGDAVAKGGAGRFYLSSGGGQTGIHGARMDDGRSAYAHYNNMEMIVLLGIAAGAAVLVFGMLSEGIMITPVVIGVLLIGGYFYLRSIRMTGKRQYDEDLRNGSQRFRSNVRIGLTPALRKCPLLRSALNVAKWRWLLVLIAKVPSIERSESNTPPIFRRQMNRRPIRFSRHPIHGGLPRAIPNSPLLSATRHRGTARNRGQGSAHPLP